MSIYKWMYECNCGYSLKAASKFMTQQEVSEMMLSHLESVHGWK